MSVGTIVVALDAMGGDHAPDVTIEGAAAAAGPELHVRLVGDARVLEPAVMALPEDRRVHLEIVDAPDKVHSHEEGARAVRSKPDSSVVVACREVREGRAAAAVSLGHTGAMMAASILHMRRIPGVIRPGIATPLPSQQGLVVLLDAGANAEAKPEHLAQYAVMGRLFAQRVLDIEDPTVGLLSIGEEAERGSDLVLASHALLKDTPGFIGNVEGRDIPRGTANVVVTDGFTGNVALKLYEASAQVLLSEIRASVRETLIGKIGGLLIRPSIRRLLARLDPDAVGGAFLLGVNGLSVIGHGSSNSTAVANAIRTAAIGVRHDLVQELAAEFGDRGAVESSA
ncbi:MAG: phosphate acyltransferase PlsX [Actinobacteria bacterium]|nr:phosphate acyltransferase PlsX [Thermoleophilia bacterium]MCB9010817.1 phosphate acyltransferase PlsX [Actinomycetota bacterium]